MSGQPSLAAKPTGPLRRAFAASALLAVFGLLVGLGTWQMQRLAWKEGLIGEIESRRHAPALSLAEIERLLGQGQSVDYRHMVAEGRFLHDRERHFLSTWQGQSGFNVYTPLALPDGRFLFVNRGFVPYDLKAPDKRPAGAVDGLQRVEGLARERLSGKPSWIVPDNDLKANVFYWKDLDAMAASTGLDPAKVVPLFLDAGPAHNPGGLPVGGVTLVDLPDNHLQYALTWYGLAAALVVVVGLSWHKRRRGRAP